MTGKRRLVFVAVLGVAALALSAGMVSAAGDTEVSVEPADENVTVNSTQTFEIVVENATDDVKGYDFNVSLSNANAEIVSVSPRKSPAVFNANISQDNTTVAVDAIWTTSNQTFQSTSPTILTVDVEGAAAGQAELNTDLATASGPYNQLVGPGGDEYNVTASNAASITVEQPSAEFEVSNLDAPSAVVLGDDVTANATITNTGSVQGSDTVEFRVGGNVVASTNVSLDAGASQNVSLTTSTAGLSTGTFTHGIFTTDDGQTAQIDVLAQAQAQFEVRDLEAPSTVAEGDVLTANATVENVGTADGDVTVELSANGSVVSSTNVSLAAGTSQGVSLSVNTSTLGQGSYTVTVSAGNSSVSSQVTVTAGGTVQLPNAAGPAQNIDSDSQLEDVDGDGSANVFDAIALYNNRDEAVVQNNPQFFDFDGDGQINVFDAIELYNEIS
jgi:hypothetical protein